MSTKDKLRGLAQNIKKEHPEADEKQFWDCFYNALTNTQDRQLEKTLEWEHMDFLDLIDFDLLDAKQ